eukprot:Gregarina_sp_Poly_1__1277@NODE_130_length_13255_cov_150_516454_g116_i0_p4_GENE_NODE_130_length_13255_cov_150_516454_g116_i0NODE_130_length_13255_cov_150_516454_g116_i0_p4_ORF_typecomplete_len493_score81_24KH_1/PF00013_29/7_6e05_NODE_130_length_13255_cov_150_516454_g116_i057857263
MNGQSASNEDSASPFHPSGADSTPTSLGWTTFLEGWKETSPAALEPVGGRNRTTSPYAVPVDRSPVTQVLDLHVTSSTAASLDDSVMTQLRFPLNDRDRIAIRIDGSPVDYELDASDIAQVFRSLTEVRDVHVSPDDPSNAYVDVAAGQGQVMVTLLDGRKLEGIDGYLSAKLVASDSQICRDGLMMRMLDSAPPLMMPPPSRLLNPLQPSSHLLNPLQPPDPPVPQMCFHHNAPSSTPCRPTLPSPSMQSVASPPLSERQLDAMDRMEYLNLFLDLYTGSKSPPGFPIPSSSPSLFSPTIPFGDEPATPPQLTESPPDNSNKWTPVRNKTVNSNRRTDESTARSTADRRASPSPPADDLAPAAQDSKVRKWTSRYEIQIDPHEGFQVTRRIIGTRGANMKKINGSTGAKLRLRGRGSGYLEGSSRQEADDPLHLCISSCDSQKYRMARAMTEKLLQEIYTDYDRWLAENDRPPAKLKIKYKELFRKLTCFV